MGHLGWTEALCLGALLGCTACGGSSGASSPAEPPPPSSNAPAEVEVAKPAPEIAEDDDEPPAPARKPAKPSEASVIEAHGVHFELAAAPVRLQDGWGVNVSLRANSIDGQPHVIRGASPYGMRFQGHMSRTGPGSISASGFGEGGTSSKVGAVSAEQELELERSYPGQTDWDVVATGTTLRLQVRIYVETAAGTERVKLGTVVVVVPEDGPATATIEAASD